MNIGNNIKNIRHQKNMTLEELGGKIGKGKVHLSLIENGKTNPSDNKLQEILTLGFGFDPPEARKTVDKWRIEERLAKGNITIDELNIGTNNGVIGENATVINNNQKNTDPESKIQQAIEMSKAGLSEDMIKKLLNL